MQYNAQVTTNSMLQSGNVREIKGTSWYHLYTSVKWEVSVSGSTSDTTVSITKDAMGP